MILAVPAAAQTLRAGDGALNTPLGGQTLFDLRTVPIQQVFGASLQSNPRVDLFGRPFPDVPGVDSVMRREEDVTIGASGTSGRGMAGATWHIHRNGQVIIPANSTIVFDVESRQAAIPPDGLLMSDRLAEKLGLAAGDRVTERSSGSTRPCVTYSVAIRLRWCLPVCAPCRPSTVRRTPILSFSRQASTAAGAAWVVRELSPANWIAWWGSAA